MSGIQEGRYEGPQAQEIEFVRALTGALQRSNKNISRFNQLFGAHLNQTYIGSQQFQHLYNLVSGFSKQGKWNTTKCDQIKQVANELIGQPQRQPPPQHQVTAGAPASTTRARKTRQREEIPVTEAGEATVTKKAKVERAPPVTPPVLPAITRTSSLFSRAARTSVRLGRHVWSQKFSYIGQTAKALSAATAVLAVGAIPAPPAAASWVAASVALFKAGHWISQISPPPALTEVPIAITNPEERRELIQRLHTAVHARVKGQEYAKQEVLKTITTNVSGAGRETSCLGCFFFAGPTGVGKTELARTISDQLFGSQKAILFLNGGQYTREGDEKTLTGSAPGYIGYDPKGGILTKHLAQYPYGIVVFDEIEKATPEVRKLFLGLLDGQGKLMDFSGNEIPCKNTIFIFTSNWGADWLSRPDVRTGDPARVAAELKKLMIQQGVAAEFIARLQKVLPFFPLDKKAVEGIVNKELQALNQRSKFKSLTLTFDPSLVEYLVRAFDSQFGIRALQQEVDKVAEMLSLDIDTAAVPSNGRVRLYVENGRLAHKVL